MNPLQFQDQTPVPDFHWHRCALCEVSWHHWKSSIPVGREFLSHACPRCGRECAFRVECTDQAISLGEVLQEDYYGASSSE